MEKLIFVLYMSSANLKQFKIKVVILIRDMRNTVFCVHLFNWIFLREERMRRRRVNTSVMKMLHSQLQSRKQQLMLPLKV